MLLSIKWLKELVDFDLTIEELDQTLTMLGIEVEGVIDYSKKYDKFYTAKVISKEKHPDADKLSICKVSDGKEERTIVCGAPNVDAGQTIVLATEGAFVPGPEFEIAKRKVRGVESNGMICSQDELELGESTGGIWVLPEGTEIGQPLANYLELNDTIFDISLTPNKADCISHLGVARDLAAYLRTKVKTENKPLDEKGENISKSLSVEILDAEKCPRYSARVIRNAKIQESPDWLKNRLIAIGLRPINAAVDVTNYVMYECGQPMHAFDLDKVAGGKIVVKTVENKTKFTTLDSKERELDDQMLMICDAEKPIAVGGVMGGENSEIDDNTTNIILESAFFHPSSVRRTSKKLAIQSDSSYRFERGVDHENIVNALNKATAMIAELTGGEIAEGMIDVYPEEIKRKEIKLRYERARKIIGIDIEDAKIKEMMEALNFVVVSEDEEGILLEVPPYRVDVTLEIDLIEEVARLYNYDNIEPNYASAVNFGAYNVPKELSLPPFRRKIRDYLVQNGFNEIITQNMMDPKSADIFAENHVVLANPLGEELSIMRPSTIASMLKTLNHNIRVGNSRMRLFELGKSFHRVDEKVPTFIEGFLEKQELTIAIAGKAFPKQWSMAERDVDYYDIKGVAEGLLAQLRIEGLKFKELKEEVPAFSKNTVALMKKKQIVGYVGEVSSKLKKHYDIEMPVFIAWFDMNAINEIEPVRPYYSKVAPFPGSTRDLAFIVAKEVKADDILNQIMQNGGKLLQSVNIFDVYEGKNVDNGKKSIAYSLHFAAPNRTLKDKEVDQATTKVIKAIEKKFEAELRG